MKKSFLIIVAFILFSNILISQTKEDFFNQSNEFFKKNINLDGKLKYAGLKKSPGELMYILKNVENLKIDSLDSNTKVAFWINSYNLLVIKNVIENYPLRSTSFVNDFFEKKFQIADNQLSLEEIEFRVKDLIKDPGYHFVLSNGTNGGSKLLNSAYLPETVMYQVSYQMKSTINKPGFIKIIKETNSIELPTVFETHKPDFVTQYFNQIDFLNVFLEKKIDNKLQITYAKRDVTLNEIN